MSEQNQTLDVAVSADSIEMQCIAQIDEKETEGVKTNPDTDPSIPPDGGYGWVVAVASAFVQFFVLSNVYAFGVLYPVYVDYFQAEQGATAWVGSIAAGVMTAIGLYVGALTDYYGDDKMIFLSGIFIAVGYILGSYATELWHLYLTQGVIVGVGLSCGFIPAVGVVAPWFTKYRGLAMGISFGGCGIGQLCFAFITKALIDAYGWRGTLRALAIIMGVGITVSSFFIKRFLPLSTKLSFAASWEMFADYKFVLLYLAVMINSLGLFTPLIYQIIYSIDKGVSPSLAVLINALCGIPSMLGRVGAGYLGGSHGDLFSLKVFMLCASAATFFWIICTTFGSILAYFLIFGFFSGGVISIVPAVSAELFGVEKLGAVMGLLLSSQAVGNLFATPIAGALYDRTGDYVAPILVSASFMTLGTIFLFAIPATGANEKNDESSNETKPAPNTSAYSSVPAEISQDESATTVGDEEQQQPVTDQEYLPVQLMEETKVDIPL